MSYSYGVEEVMELLKAGRRVSFRAGWVACAEWLAERLLSGEVIGELIGDEMENACEGFIEEVATNE